MTSFELDKPMNAIAAVSIFASWTTILSPGGGRGDVLAQSRAVREFVDERYDTIGKLISVARLSVVRPNEIDEAAIAFRKLGHMRATEAIPLLTEYLTFDPYGQNLKRGSPVFERNYPCAFALSSIGMPAIPELIARVAATDDERVHNLAAVVVRKVLDAEMAKVYLRRQQMSQKEPAKAARVGRLIRIVANLNDEP